MAPLKDGDLVEVRIKLGVLLLPSAQQVPRSLDLCLLLESRPGSWIIELRRLMRQVTLMGPHRW